MLLCLVIKQLCYIMGEKCWFIFRRGKSIAGTRGWGEQTKRQAQLLTTVISPWTLCSVFLFVAVTGGEDLLSSVGHLSCLGSEVIFICPSLDFPICSAVFIYCPVLHGASRPLDLVPSKQDKSCLWLMFSVGSSTIGKQPRDLLDACEAFEVSSALGS